MFIISFYTKLVLFFRIQSNLLGKNVLHIFSKTSKTGDSSLSGTNWHSFQRCFISSNIPNRSFNYLEENDGPPRILITGKCVVRFFD